VFLILSSLEILAERHQKSISVEFDCSNVFAFKHHGSAADVIWNRIYIHYLLLKHQVVRSVWRG
jgi:hypothetical protein